MLKLLLADWLHADVTAIPIREAVFIKEQNVPEVDEWDDDDLNLIDNSYLDDFGMDEEEDDNF